MGIIIAIGGKGGVGKTFVSAILTKILKDRFNVLCIDADPSLGLTYALDMSPKKTIWDIREALKDNRGRKKLMGDDDIPIKKVIKDQVVINKNGFDFLVMGRAEGPGCFCSVNELLRYAIDSLAKEYEIVLVDCEAGLEQVNRRVLRNMDVLILISDPSIRGIQTVRYLSDIAKELSTRSEDLRRALIFNMVDDIEKTNTLTRHVDVPVLGYIPADPIVREFDLHGRSLLDFPSTSPAYKALYSCLKRIPQINSTKL